MNFLPKLLYTALFSAVALAAAPVAQAQVNVNINTAPPAWGPPAPQGTQFYYIPEIDGYYDLYAQQYIVYRNGQWVPVAVVDGYDPYQFHPVVLDYRGREPWVYVRANRARYPRTVVVRPRTVVVQPRPVIVQRGLPPGQAKKLYREGYREGRQNGNHGNGRGNGNGHGRSH